MSTGRGAGQATLSARQLYQLYQRFRQLIHEGAKFGIVGGIGVIVVLAGSDALHYELGLGKFTSVTVATVFATVVTFLGNRYWSFRHRQGAGAGNETVLFFILNGVGLLIQYACIFLVTDLLSQSGRVWYTIANFLGIGIGTLFRFWSYRKWIWVHPEVALAKLRSGRHRKGRPTPATPPTQPGPQRHPQHPLPARTQPAPQYAAPPHLPPPHGPPQYGSRQYAAPQYVAPPHAAPLHSGPRYDSPRYDSPRYDPSKYDGAQYGDPPRGAQPSDAQVRPGGMRYPTHPVHPPHPVHPTYPTTHPGVQPMLAATHIPAPTAEDPDRWTS